MSVMIHEIDEAAMRTTYFPLLGEIEWSRYFKPDNPHHVEWLSNRLTCYLTRGARYYACHRDDGTAVGIFGLILEKAVPEIPWTGHKAELVDIGVYAEYRRQGYGTQMLAHAEGIAQSRGYPCIDLLTSAPDPRAVHFYVKNGYVPTAVIPDAYGPGTWSELWMRKMLKG